MNPRAVARNPYGRPMTDDEVRAELTKRYRETAALYDAIVARDGLAGWRRYLLEKRAAQRAGRPYHVPTTSRPGARPEPTLF